MAKRWQHFDFEPPLPLNASRRMAMATWHSRLQNPQAYVCLDLDVTHALAVIAQMRASHNERVTLTHVLAAILGRIMRNNPELRSVIRHHRIYPRKDVSLLIQVAVTRDKLSAVVLSELDQKTPTQIAAELNQRVAELRNAGDSEQYKGANQLIERLPVRVTGWLLRLIGYLSFPLNLNPRLLGLPSNPYGCMRLNNLGALGVDDAIGPFVDWMHSPGTFVMMKLRDELQWVNEQVRVRKKLRFWCAADHRLLDGGAVPRARAEMDYWLEHSELLWQSAP